MRWALAHRCGGALVLLVCLLATPWMPARADPLPAPVIMVVDPQLVMQQSKAGQQVRAMHDQYRQTFQRDLDASRKTLSADESALVKQKSALSQDIFQQKARAFDQRVIQFNQKFQKMNLAIENSYRAAMNELGQAFARVTAEVASKEGANLVLPVQQVVLHDPRMDLTKTVIERMDIEVPSVTFPPPAMDGGEAVTTGPSESMPGIDSKK
jgi:outer membrane protein